MNKSQRIIFKSKDELNAIRKLSIDYFWDLDELIQADVSNGISYELHFTSDDKDFEVVYIEDPISECNYVIVSGKRVNETCSLIMEKTNFWTSEEMFLDWSKASNDTEKILAILRIGVGAPYKYDEYFAKKFEAGLNDIDEAVREATLAAIGYQDWPEFDEKLESTAENDSAQRCRNRAKYMLEVREEQRELF